MIKIKLRELLWEKDITAVKLSEVTGISTANISKIIRGRHVNIGLETVNKLCLFFNCKIEDLLEFCPD